ncbi:hypothetical protein Sjap_003745 [Stephania japonica]|uniref:WIT1/2 N-terminal helical bundle domain-containing protein n=1 Tax=Stephania japonica TaxID=461633 RepID=A0AAP0PVC1_9MAGN
MAESTGELPTEVQVKVVDNTADDVLLSAKGEADGQHLTNGISHQKGTEGNKELEETTSDGEFIKVERESLDLKDNSPSTEAEATLIKEDEASILEWSGGSVPSRDFVEAQEKLKELELELERMTGELKNYESENIQLKEEILVTKEKLAASGKQCEDHELSQKRMKEQIFQAEEKYNSQFSTLQEALQAQETKHRELTDLKEAFDGLTVETESSRNKLIGLELALQSMTDEARKFEELSVKHGSSVESETQRALEFERSLESAKASAKETEDQIASLQEELKDLYKKVAEYQQVEEGLKNTLAELSPVQGELELSKSQVSELQKTLASNEVIINELTQDVELRKAAEIQMKDDIAALETLVSSTKDNLLSRATELEDTVSKLQEEMNTRELVEGKFREREERLSTLQQELAKVSSEKVALEASVEDLNGNLLRMKELCDDLETKLKLSDENFSKTDSLLSQALSNNAELEQKLKVLEEHSQKSSSLVSSAQQRSVELEDTIQASNAAAEEAKLQLREIETQLISAEQKNVELEQKLNLVELKSSNAEREVQEYVEKLSELNAALTRVEEEKTVLQSQLQGSEDKITQLETALNDSSLKNSELEQELKVAVKKSAEHEERSSMSHQRCLELEDLFQTSHSKLEDAGRKVSEVELLHETANYRIKELEEQISALETKGLDKEEQSRQVSDKVSELVSQLEIFQQKVSSFEKALQEANEKERELTESLRVVTEEKKILEDAANNSSAKLSESQNLLDVLQNELKSTRENLEIIERDLKASGVRESGILEKLKAAEEQLVQRGREIEQATTDRDTEAKSLNEQLKTLEENARIYEEQAAAAVETSASLKVELDQGLMKLVALESTIEELNGKVLESENRASLTYSENELLVEANLQLKSKVDELQEQLSSAHNENEATSQQLASHMNSIAELTEQHSRVSALHSESESRVRDIELQLHEANSKYSSRDLEAKSLDEKLLALESAIRFHEENSNNASTAAETHKAELEEALLKVKQLESIVQELQSDSAQFGKEREGLTESTLKLRQEVSEYETKSKELETLLSVALAEKNETAEQLHSSKKVVEEVTQQLAAEVHKLQSQISSLSEEKILLNETHHEARNELQAAIVHLEGQLNEEKVAKDSINKEMENLKVELADKSGLHARISELEQQLALAETRLKDEVESIKSSATEKEAGLISKLEEQTNLLKDVDILNEKLHQLQKDLSLAQSTIAEQNEASSKKELERAETSKNSHVELEAKHQQVILFERKVEDLKHELNLAYTNSAEKDEETKRLVAELREQLENKSRLETELGKNIAELENQLKSANAISQNQNKDGVEIKSRDLGSTIATPPKKKSKRRSEAATSAQTSSSAETSTQGSDVSASMSFKFILGVALVSIIIGVILGKRY